MEILTTTTGGIKLKADDGKVLTNGESYSSVGGYVYLGKYASVDDWWEIDASEVPAEEELGEPEELEE